MTKILIKIIIFCIDLIAYKAESGDKLAKTFLAFFQPEITTQTDYYKSSSWSDWKDKWEKWKNKFKNW